MPRGRRRKKGKRKRTRREALFMTNAVLLCSTAGTVRPNDMVARAMFNSGLDVPIEDPSRAVAVVLAVNGVKRHCGPKRRLS